MKIGIFPTVTLKPEVLKCPTLLIREHLRESTGLAVLFSVRIYYYLLVLALTLSKLSDKLYYHEYPVTAAASHCIHTQQGWTAVCAPIDSQSSVFTPAYTALHIDRQPW